MTDASSSARVLLASLLVVLSACAGDPGTHGGTSDAPLPPGGYAAAVPSSVTTTAHDWLVGGRAVGILLSEPASPQLLPVIVYVPGLGESNGSGDRWRAGWSAAGYAVVSVQPLLEDETAWTSPLARDGDFKALGRERYGAEATRLRLDVLRATLAEARRRSRSGEAAWDRIDWDRAVIAGFDLGAYTALAWLQRSHGASDAPDSVRFRAALAISPYASVARLANDDRGAIDVPVLAIGGDADGDPLGIVEPSAPADRFLDRLGGPDRSVLWMAGLTHANLSGTVALDRAADRKPQASSNGAGSRRGRKGGSASASKQPNADRADDGEPELIPDLAPADARTRTQQAVQVSMAFLDMSLKGDARARAWLATSAPPWLGKSGELRRPTAHGPSD